MTGFAAGNEQGGDDTGSALEVSGPASDAANRWYPGEPADGTLFVEYPFEFATAYPGPGGGCSDGESDYSESGAADGFGWPAATDRAVPEQPADDFGDEAAMVRPYAWTRGRTRANYDLKLETLISTTSLGEDETLLPQLEHRAVSSLCRYPLSVAEVAAKLSIPLGVARVILSDMAELGLISIHRTFADDDIAAHLVLMERVLSGLRRL